MSLSETLLPMVKLSDKTLEAILLDACQAQNEKGLFVYVPPAMVLEALREAGFSFDELNFWHVKMCGDAT